MKRLAQNLGSAAQILTYLTLEVIVSDKCCIVARNLILNGLNAKEIPLCSEELVLTWRHHGTRFHMWVLWLKGLIHAWRYSRLITDTRASFSFNVTKINPVCVRYTKRVRYLWKHWFLLSVYSKKQGLLYVNQRSSSLLYLYSTSSEPLAMSD